MRILILFTLSLVIGISTGFTQSSSSPNNSFFVVHCDPDFADITHYNQLRKMIDTADAHNVPLTLQMTPQWVDFILANPARLDTIRTWQARGHEIAAHHHGIYHCYYDGYTNYPLDSVVPHQQSLGAMCPKDPTITSTMQQFWNKLDSIAGDSLMLTWGASDENPAVDMYPDIPYRTDGGRDDPSQGFSNPYTATHGPTIIGQETYGPYTTCSIDYYFIDAISSVNDMINLYNDSIGFSNAYNTVGVVTHVFDFKEASTLPWANNYFYQWINFIEGKGCKTARQILRESSCKTTGIDVIRSNDIAVFPNPTTGKVYIKNEANDPWNVYLLNLYGQEIKAEKNAAEVDLSSLAEGIYILKLAKKSGKVITKKIVKK